MNMLVVYATVDNDILKKKIPKEQVDFELDEISRSDDIALGVFKIDENKDVDWSNNLLIKL